MSDRHFLASLAAAAVVCLAGSGCSEPSPRRLVQYRSAENVDYVGLPGDSALAAAQAAFDAAPRDVDSIIRLGVAQSGRRQFREAIEEELIDYARIDLCIVGGLTESLKVTQLGERCKVNRSSAIFRQSAVDVHGKNLELFQWRC